MASSRAAVPLTYQPAAESSIMAFRAPAIGIRWASYMRNVEARSGRVCRIDRTCLRIFRSSL
jgi:hypothetical protein